MKEQRVFSDWKEVHLESSMREENVEGKLVNDLDVSLVNQNLSFSFAQDIDFCACYLGLVSLGLIW